MPIDYYSALRLHAIRAVQKPDIDSNLRYIHRWYSKTFHTPLHVVADLDPEDILTAFYETTYEDMSEEDREQEIRELLETDEEKSARLRAKDEERADAYEFAKHTAEEERRKEDQKRLKDLELKEKRKFQQVPEAALPKPMTTAMKDLKELPPDIEMKFTSAEDFEAELEGFGTMMPGKKP